MIAELAAVAVVLVVLSACSVGAGHDQPPPSGPSQPAPHDPPVPPPPLETVLFRSDFSQPSIGLKMAVTQDTPVFVVAPDDGIYGTFDRSGSGGANVVDPGPNDFYQTQNGVLHLHAPPGDPGFPVCTKQSFPLIAGRTLAMECRMTATAVHPGAWGGLVFYNGEANWIAVYVGPEPDGYSMRVWNMTKISDVIYGPLPLGEFVDVGIYYRDGVLTFRAGDKTFANPLEPMVITHNPHCAVFLGDCDLAVTDIVVKDVA